MTVSLTKRLLFEGPEWNFDTIKRTYDAIEEIAKDDLGLDTYPNQIELITSEQMLDAYSSIGLPLLYRHWSFGKRFAQDQKSYRKGRSGLAYEIVINSDPCVSYMLEDNSMALQATVMAHAAFGHNHFFKHNRLFRQWTDAKSILDYLQFAKGYVARCEERHGVRAVERLLDAAHALMDHGVDRYQRRTRPNLARDQRRAADRREQELAEYNDLWRTLPGESVAHPREPVPLEGDGGRADRTGLPEENLLYFLEKHGPTLRDWQREILRIVRNIAQYFYPQKLTKVINEGCATFVHYVIMERLYERRLIDEGTMLEFLESHSSVVLQPDFDDHRFGGLNPYWLGFEILRDVARIVSNPTTEDEQFLPEIAGRGDVFGTLRRIWAEYRDDSFILQFLSPAVIRKLRLFKVIYSPNNTELLVGAIHDERGYDRVRRALANSYDPGNREPNLQVSDFDFSPERRLVLTHTVQNGFHLHEADAKAVLRYIAEIWGGRVELRGVDPDSGYRLYSYDIESET